MLGVCDGSSMRSREFFAAASSETGQRVAVVEFSYERFVPDLT